MHGLWLEDNARIFDDERAADAATIVSCVAYEWQTLL
jgi:hypothetical protein